MTAVKNAEAILCRETTSEQLQNDFLYHHSTRDPFFPSLSDLEHSCLSHMAANGIPFSGPLITDWENHRFSIDAKKNKKDEQYKAKTWTSRGKHYLMCLYKSWSNPDKSFKYESWKEWGACDFSKEERKEIQRLISEAEEQTERERKERQEVASAEAIRIWSTSSREPMTRGQTEYLRRKKLREHGYGARFGKSPKGYDNLIIPLWNIKGQIRTLQFISVSDDGIVYKTFLEGGEKKGCFFILGDLKKAETFFVAEGYATAASIHEATGKPVVVAVDCGNLEHAIAALRTKYSNQKIIIAGDDDKDTELKFGKNEGKEKAKVAANKYGCEVVLPRFPENFRLLNGKRPTDFNDLHVHFGLEAIKEQVLGKEERILKIASKISENILQRKKPTERFSTEHLPNILKELVAEMSFLTKADPIMMTMALLSSISGFFKTNHWIPQGEYFQDLYPNLWSLMIIGSGQFKSTSIDIGSVLSKTQHNLIEGKVDGKRKEKNLPTEAIDKDPDVIELRKKDVTLPNLCTAQALLEDLSMQRGGAIFHGEFSVWLSQMEKSYNEGLKALFTLLFDVPENFESKTKGGGTTRIRRPFITLCCVSALDWLQGQITPKDVASGFFARFLLFLPEKNEETPNALPQQKDLSFLRKKEEETLKITQAAASQIRKYRLSPQARVLFEKVHNEMYEKCRQYNDQAQAILSPYLKRWSPYILKLAMNFQPFFEWEKRGEIKVCEDEVYEIDEEAIRAALSIIELAITSTVFLFETELGESDQQTKCRRVTEYIAKKNGRVVRHQLLSSHVLEGGCKMYDYVLETLLACGKIEAIPSETGGDKNIQYVLKNPENDQKFELFESV